MQVTFVPAICLCSNRIAGTFQCNSQSFPHQIADPRYYCKYHKLSMQLEIGSLGYDPDFF